MERTPSLLSGSELVQHHRTGMKELPEVGVKLFEPTGSWFETNRLHDALDERYSLLNEPRIERDTLLSLAKWDAEKKKVVVTKKRGKEYATYGHHDSIDNLDYLNPEEALFLLESNSLTLFHGNIEVSVEMSYSLLLSEEAGCTLDQYRVFSHLSRLGYKLIRHNKPTAPNKSHPDNSRSKDNTIIIDDDTSVEIIDVDRPYVRGKRTGKSKPAAKDEEVVLVESSDSDGDVEIVDEFDGSLSRDIIQIGDDDSRDSDLVVVEPRGTVELPLENWSYVSRWRFLNGFRGDGLPVIVDALVLSQRETDILDELPNIKGRKSWLYRPEDILIPDGVWPFHFKYLIDLCEERNNRGRGGYRGRGFRGRGWHLQRQVSQMKNYTISLMNVVSQLMGGHGVQAALPPPPTFFSGPNYGSNRGPRGRTTWGRISLNTRGSNYRPGHCTETVVLSDDEEETSRPKRHTSDADDIETKRVKLDPDGISDDSDSSVRSGPSDVKEEISVKEEDADDVKPDVSSFDHVISVKSETVKHETEIKSEIKSEEKTTVKSENNSTSSDTSNNMVSHRNPSQQNIVTLPEIKSDGEVPLSLCNSPNGCENKGECDKQGQENPSENSEGFSAEADAGSSAAAASRNLAQNIKVENSGDTLKRILTNISKQVKTECVVKRELPESNIDAKLSVCADCQSNLTSGSNDVVDSEMKELPESKSEAVTNNQDETKGGNTDTSDENKTEGENKDVKDGSENFVSPSSSKHVSKETDDSSCIEMKELPQSNLSLNMDSADVEIKDSNSESQHIVKSQSISSDVTEEIVTPDCVKMKELPEPLTLTETNVEENSKNSDKDKDYVDVVSKSDASKDSEILDTCETKKADLCKEIETSTCVEMNNLPESHSKSKTNLEVGEDKSLEDNSIVSKSMSIDVSESIDMKDLPTSKNTTETVVENYVSNVDSTNIASQSVSTDFSKETEDSTDIEMNEASQSKNTTEINNKDIVRCEDTDKNLEKSNVPNSVSSDKSKESGKPIGGVMGDGIVTENKSNSKPILLSDDSSSSDKISSSIKTNEEPMLVDSDPTETVRESLIDHSYFKEIEDSEEQAGDGSAQPEDEADKTTTWKKLKENEKSVIPVEVDNLTSMQEDQVEQVHYGKPLIEEKHCKSLGDVLKRLQIFGQYEAKNEPKETELVEVKYDVYLPTSNYYRNLPPHPDFRLIILNLDDNLPDAEEMRCLRQLYSDNKNFLFAVTLRESIAYYQYDTVFIPVNSDPS